jgi:hypothetical protein
MTRVELERLLVAEKCIVQPLQLGQNIAEICPSLDIVRLELQRLVEGLEGFFVPPLALQRGPEAGKIGRFRILPDGAGKPFYGVVVLLGVMRQQAHQMQGIRVVGIGRERLLAAHLGVKIPLGPQMAKTCLTQRSRCGGGAGTGRSRLTFSTGSPSFVTIHRRISKEFGAAT